MTLKAEQTWVVELSFPNKEHFYLGTLTTECNLPDHELNSRMWDFVHEFFPEELKFDFFKIHKGTVIVSIQE